MAFQELVHCSLCVAPEVFQSRVFGHLLWFQVSIPEEQTILVELLGSLFGYKSSYKSLNVDMAAPGLQ